jgi:hypothetical protein
MAAHTVSVLCARGEIEFSLRGLPDFAPRIAAVCCTPVSQLVSAPHSEAGKLEGTELQGLASTL